MSGRGGEKESEGCERSLLERVRRESLVVEAWKGERDGKGSVSRGTMQRIWQRTNLSREGLDADPQHLQSDPRAVSGMLADEPDDTSPSLRVPYTGELASETGD